MNFIKLTRFPFIRNNAIAAHEKPHPTGPAPRDGAPVSRAAPFSPPMTSTASAMHRPRPLPVIARAAEAYAIVRDRQDVRLPRCYPISPEHREFFKDHRLYFFPGFLNFTAGICFLDQFSVAVGKGAAFVSVSQGAIISQRGKHVMLGSGHAEYYGDWTRELATVIARVADDLKGMPAEDRPKRLVVMGHSKGGLLVYALAALQKYYRENNGHISEKIRQKFTGMDELSRPDIELVLNALDYALFVAVATPFFGLDPNVLKYARLTQFDRIFKNASFYFSPDFLNNIYEVFGLNAGPTELVTLAVFGNMANTVARPQVSSTAWMDLAKNLAGLPVLLAADELFRAGGTLMMPHCPSDGLVPHPGPARFRHMLTLNADHIKLVEDPAFAVAILRELANNIA